MPRRLWVVIGPFVGRKVRIHADEERDRHDEWNRILIVEGVFVRVAEIPCQFVLVAEDVAAGAERVALRAERRVVEEPAPHPHAGRFGVRHCHVRDFAPLPRVDHGDRVVEPRQAVEPSSVSRERETGRPATGNLHLVACVREKRVFLERRGGVDTDLARIPWRRRRGFRRRALTSIPSGIARLRTLSGFGDGAQHVAEIDVLVQVSWQNAAPVEHRDPLLDECWARTVWPAKIPGLRIASRCDASMFDT